MVVGAKFRPLQAPAQHRAPRMVNRRSIALFRKSLAQHRDRLRRDSHCRHTKVATDPDDQPGDTGVKVHVLMRVDVIEGQTGCLERCELRPDLHRELAASTWGNKKSDPGAGHVAVELAVVADELRDLDLGQKGTPVN